MKKLLILIILLFLRPLAYSQNPQTFTVSSPEDAGFNSKRLQKIDSFYQDMVDKGLAPNAITFIARNGKIIHNKTFGFSDVVKKQTLKKDDIFRIASQTKAITSVALLILYEEGKVLLEDPISRYIPAFKNPRILEEYDKKTFEYKTRPAKSEITIRHLLTHTAGIPYEHPLQEKSEFKIPFFTSVQKLTLAEVIPKLAARPLVAEPGEKFVYGLNTDVVGYLVEVISGQSLAAFVESRILTPLGMKDTHFFLPKEKESRLVELYIKSKTTEKLAVHPDEELRKFAVAGARTYYSGGAGLVSTIEDYAKFCQMILNDGSFNGARILSRKTIELMGMNHIGELEVWDRRDKFGYGFQIITEDSHYGGQATVGSLTWGGKFCSEYTIDSKEKLIMLVFTNVDEYAHYGDFVRKFRVMTYQAIE